MTGVRDPCYSSFSWLLRPVAGLLAAAILPVAAVFGADVAAGPGPGGGWRVHTVLRLDPAPVDSGPAEGR